MVNLPIDFTFKRIDQEYQAGCLAWMKRTRPKEWRRMIGLETEVKRLAFLDDEAGLTRTLSEYEVFVLDMVRTFKIRIVETGNLFQKEMR